MKRLCITGVILLSLIINACDQFVELDTPKTQIVSAKVFANDAGHVHRYLEF